MKIINDYLESKTSVSKSKSTLEEATIDLLNFGFIFYTNN